MFSLFFEITIEDNGYWFYIFESTPILQWKIKENSKIQQDPDESLQIWKILKSRSFLIREKFGNETTIQTEVINKETTATT